MGDELAENATHTKEPTKHTPSCLIRTMMLSSRLLSFLDTQCHSLAHLTQIHAQMLVSGLLLADPAAAGRLVAFCALSDPSNPAQLLHSHALLATLKNPNTFSWNVAIRGFAVCSHPALIGHTVPLYRSLLRSGGAAGPDRRTYPFLLKACARMAEFACGNAVLGHVVQLGFDSDVFVVNAAIHFFAVCGFLGDARKVFDESCVRDLVSWNTVINAYVQRGLPREALEVFGAMLGDGEVRPDEVTMLGVVSCCTQLRDLELGREFHGYIEQNGVNLTVPLMNTLMDMYVKCGSLEPAKLLFDNMTKRTVVSWTTMIVGYAKFGWMEDARRVFDEMPERDVFPWNALLAGYVQCKRGRETIALFHEMQASNVEPDEVTMISLLSACSQLRALEMGMWVHHYIDRRRLLLNVALGTSLVDMYAKCGNIEKAAHVFRDIPEKNALTWTAMICGLANHGDAKEAIEHFRTMIELGLQPDEVTFIGVLSACCHAGLVTEGRELFTQMSLKYRLQRKMKHYSCMIDLLGRAGYLDEAEELVNTMPMEPDAVVWGALFSACRMHGNVTLGEKAAMKLVELDPSDSGIYVLLANMYAEANMRKKADKVRVMMRNLGVEKIPGCSCIELNGVVHEFIVRDNSHPDSGAIYECLHELTWQMRKAKSMVDI